MWQISSPKTCKRHSNPGPTLKHEVEDLWSEVIVAVE